MTPSPAAVLQRLIRIDTSNPPGGETRAADHLRTILEPAGVQCTLVARDPRRANLVARIPGSGDGPRLAFLCHLDVVPTDTREWSVDPYGGMIRDGQIWGRGAVDMKSQLAAVTVALARLAADGFRPHGDVMLLAVADEEVGDEKVGMPWLVEERADLAPDFVVGEGSGERLPTSAGPVYMLDHGVKASSSATLTVHGSSGDASLPRSGDNALGRLGELLARLDRRPPSLHLLPELEPLLATLAPGDEPLAGRAARARAQHPALDRLIEALLSNVITATQAHANGPANAVSADEGAPLHSRTTRNDRGRPRAGTARRPRRRRLRARRRRARRRIDIAAQHAATPRDRKLPRRTRPRRTTRPRARLRLQRLPLRA